MTKKFLTSAAVAAIFCAVCFIGNSFAGDEKAVAAEPAAANPGSEAAPAAKPAPQQKPAPAYMDYLDTAESVDHAVEVTFANRKPLMPDLPSLTAAWKAIVADAAANADAAPKPITALNNKPPVKIIYDTDIGTDVDDAIALAFALRRPEIKVMAITTSRIRTKQRAAVVSRLLKVMDKTDIPFAPGPETLFDGTTREKEKPVNQLPFAGPEDDRPKAAFDDAQDLIKKVVEENPGEVWLVIVGPFTNAAILLRDHPDVAAKLKGMVCMGGDLSRKQNETNIDNDRPAAAVVFPSGMLKFMGTDDITMRILVPKQDLERMKRTDTPTTNALLELIGYWKNMNARNKPGPALFDICPVVWLIAPDMFTTIETGVVVQGGKTLPTAEMPHLAASTNVDAVAVHRLMIDTLTSK